MAASSFGNVPWQLDWKRPDWQSVVTPTTIASATNDAPDTSSDPIDASGRHIPTFHAAASVTFDEIKDFRIRNQPPLNNRAALRSSGNSATIDQIQKISAEDDDVSYILTVTLLQSQGTVDDDTNEPSQQYSNVQLADIVQLEIIEQRQPPPPSRLRSSGTYGATTIGDESSSQKSVTRTSQTNHNDPSSHVAMAPPNVVLTCHQSRVLRWPASTLFYPYARDSKPVGWWQRAWNSPEQQIENNTIRQPTVGLVSAAWIRMPPQSTTNPNNAADALDVIQLMALRGYQHVPEQPQKSKQNDSEIINGIDSTDSDNVNRETAIPELRLACLSSDGKIHIFSPWSLLKRSIGETKSNLSESMATLLFFGTTLLDVVNDNMLPLSQPIHTIRLSIPFLRENTQTVVRGPPKLGTLPPKTRNATNARGDAKQVPTVWDSSVWDPTVDTETIQNQTKDNIPTCCVAAFDYLAIAGRGIRRWRQHGSNIDDGVTTSNIPTGDDNDAAPMESNDDHDDEYHRVNDGGFVTFLSLRHFTEVRTVFLPFVPDHLSPFSWLGLSLLCVTGRDARNISRAVAIRLDSSLTRIDVTDLGKSNNNDDNLQINNDERYRHTSDGYLPNNDNPMIHRFHILPIHIPVTGQELPYLIGCSEPSSSPPAVAVLVRSKQSGHVAAEYRTLSSIEVKRQVELDPLLSPFSDRKDQMAIIINTVQSPGHIAQDIPIDSQCWKSLSKGALWCNVGQGWCAVGCKNNAFFVCFEGASYERNAFVSDLFTGDSMERFNGLASSILPLNPFNSCEQLVVQESQATLPNGRAIHRTANNQIGFEYSDEAGTIDPLIVDAMESISSLNYRESIVDNAPLQSPRRKSSSFTHREKSARLLQKCGSWIQSVSSDRVVPRYNAQIPRVSVRLGADVCSQYVLTLRKAAVARGAGSPFHQVLSWLSEHGDYFTAASLALDLLRDTESLVHLWRTFNKIDDENERSRLEGLLDGIIPIHGDNLQFFLTELADMTVGCLSKGGFSMSSTLEEFLGRDLHYDPSRACLMLVAVAACTLSDDEELVLSAMGKQYERGDGHATKILWPVRCLLIIGVRRDVLRTALLLLNSAIPDELRRHQRGGTVSTSVPSLELCKNLVTLIVASAPEAAGMLLDLFDEKNRCRYWQAVQHDTRLELCLISIDGKYPLLREHEIRAWMLVVLQSTIESEKSLTSSRVNDFLPTKWLKVLVFACLQNAGCNTLGLTEAGDLGEEKYDEDGLKHHTHIVTSTQRALTAASGSGGLDFNLLIPSLLILEYRHVLWKRAAKTSTRSVLNSSCYLAGRRASEEPLFTLDSATIMRQCTLLGDVEAGAKLLGGKNGLILECCHILIEVLDMNMDDAEHFLLVEPMTYEKLGLTIGETREFVVESWHQHILLLLEEHVLRIRTYGEFETMHIRGKVDPVFAARICFRTWWSITRPHTSVATEWLVQWLRKRLLIDDEDRVCPYRLACAALVRALLWPESPQSSKDLVLASQLEMDGRFIVQLSRSCCGLVEALPTYVTKETLGISK